MTQHQPAHLQLTVSLHNTERVCTLERSSIIDITSHIRRHLRIRTEDTTLDRLRLIRWESSRTECGRRNALLNPVDDGVKCGSRKGSSTTVAVCDARRFEIAQEIMRLRIQLQDTIVVVGSAVGWDELVG